MAWNTPGMGNFLSKVNPGGVTSGGMNRGFGTSAPTTTNNQNPFGGGGQIFDNGPLTPGGGGQIFDYGPETPGMDWGKMGSTIGGGGIGAPGAIQVTPQPAPPSDIMNFPAPAGVNPSSDPTKTYWHPAGLAGYWSDKPVTRSTYLPEALTMARGGKVPSRRKLKKKKKVRKTVTGYEGGGDVDPDREPVPVLPEEPAQEAAPPRRYEPPAPLPERERWYTPQPPKAPLGERDPDAPDLGESASGRAVPAPSDKEMLTLLTLGAAGRGLGVIQRGLDTYRENRLRPFREGMEQWQRENQTPADVLRNYNEKYVDILPPSSTPPPRPQEPLATYQTKLPATGRYEPPSPGRQYQGLSPSPNIRSRPDGPAYIGLPSGKRMIDWEAWEPYMQSTALHARGGVVEEGNERNKPRTYKEIPPEKVETEDDHDWITNGVYNDATPQEVIPGNVIWPEPENEGSLTDDDKYELARRYDGGGEVEPQRQFPQQNPGYEQQQQELADRHNTLTPAEAAERDEGRTRGPAIDPDREVINNLEGDRWRHLKDMADTSGRMNQENWRKSAAKWPMSQNIEDERDIVPERWFRNIDDIGLLMRHMQDKLDRRTLGSSRLERDAGINDIGMEGRYADGGGVVGGTVGKWMSQVPTGANTPITNMFKTAIESRPWSPDGGGGDGGSGGGMPAGGRQPWSTSDATPGFTRGVRRSPFHQIFVPGLYGEPAYYALSFGGLPIAKSFNPYEFAMDDGGLVSDSDGVVTGGGSNKQNWYPSGGPAGGGGGMGGAGGMGSGSFGAYTPSASFADGGLLDDVSQGPTINDTYQENYTVDPLDMVDDTLQFGRQKMGLPEDFETGQYASSYDDGGMVPAEEEDNQGVIARRPPPDPRQTLGYLAGEGALAPDVVNALEQRVDPQGAMSPSARTMAALQAAPTMDTKFGYVQSKRQQYNAFSGAARHAIDQGQLGQAAAYATQAFAQVPDNHDIQVAPTQDGRFAVRATPLRTGGPSPRRARVKGYQYGGFAEEEDPFVTIDSGGPGGGGGADRSGIGGGRVVTAEELYNMVNNGFDSAAEGRFRRSMTPGAGLMRDPTTGEEVTPGASFSRPLVERLAKGWDEVARDFMRIGRGPSQVETLPPPPEQAKPPVEEIKPPPLPEPETGARIIRGGGAGRNATPNSVYVHNGEAFMYDQNGNLVPGQGGPREGTSLDLMKGVVNRGAAVGRRGTPIPAGAPEPPDEGVGGPPRSIGAGIPTGRRDAEGKEQILPYALAQQGLAIDDRGDVVRPDRGGMVPKPGGAGAPPPPAAAKTAVPPAAGAPAAGAGAAGAGAGAPGAGGAGAPAAARTGPPVMPTMTPEIKAQLEKSVDDFLSDMWPGDHNAVMRHALKYGAAWPMMPGERPSSASGSSSSASSNTYGRGVGSSSRSSSSWQRTSPGELPIGASINDPPSRGYLQAAYDQWGRSAMEQYRNESRAYELSIGAAGRERVAEIQADSREVTAAQNNVRQYIAAAQRATPGVKLEDLAPGAESLLKTNPRISPQQRREILQSIDPRYLGDGVRIGDEKFINGRWYRMNRDGYADPM